MFKVFNQNVLTEGWYWAARSDSLKAGKAMKFNLLDKSYVIFRTKSGKLSCLDGACPHMGAHLGEGKVEGEGIRCMFHNWKIMADGSCGDIPCLSDPKHKDKVSTQSWPVEDRYGLIWIYAGKEVRFPLPYVTEFKGKQVDAKLANHFQKPCHPNIVMINAIDEQHFASVHPMVGGMASELSFHVTPKSENQLEFFNQNPVPQRNFIGRFVAKFYKKQLTYWMTYFNASTGTVTIGPDFFHFHIMFALRPTKDFKTEGQTILITKKRKGVLGWCINQVVFAITNVVGSYFAEGDTQIFRSIKFQLNNIVPRDKSILAFIKHTERLPLANIEDASKQDVQKDEMKVFFEKSTEDRHELPI